MMKVALLFLTAVVSVAFSQHQEIVRVDQDVNVEEFDVDERKFIKKKIGGFSKKQLEKLFRSWLLIKQHRAFLQLPNLSLGCGSETGNVEIGLVYTLRQWDNCTVRDYRSALYGVKSQAQWEDDVAIPIITESSFRFFNQKIKQPSILLVSSNGIVTIGYQEDAEIPVSNLSTPNEPFKVIAPLWTDLKPLNQDSRVYWGYFRRGSSVKCTGIQWNGFITQTTDTPVNYQLDICSDGEFVARHNVAESLDPVEVGVKTSNGVDFSETSISFGAAFSFPLASAVVMSYTD